MLIMSFGMEQVVRLYGSGMRACNSLYKHLDTSLSIYIYRDVHIYIYICIFMFMVHIQYRSSQCAASGVVRGSAEISRRPCPGAVVCRSGEGCGRSVLPP
jgi:hypothetical protein